MRYSDLFFTLSSTFILLALIGCSVSENKSHLQQRAQSNLVNITTWHYQQQNATSATQLTELIDIPQLTQLVKQAVSNNPDAQQMAMNLKIAYAQRGIVNSDRIPQATTEINSHKHKENSISHNSEIRVSWEIDLWQKIQNTVDAANMDIASAQANYQATLDTLIANIMRTWLAISLQKQLIEIEESRLKSLTDNETFIIKRYRNGLGSLEDLDNARSSSATTQATLANYREQLSQNKRTLSLLLGEAPEKRAIQISSEFPTVLQPLANIPAQDLARRPDLQSAYHLIIAEQYRTQAAYKALLPSINLSAAFTGEELFNNPVWELLGQLTAPLFLGGKLRAQAEIAQLTAEKAYWNYQSTLLNAVNEVENTLGQEQSLSRQQQHIHQALQTAKRSFIHYQKKYSQGLVDIIELLATQQRTFNLQSQLTQLIYNRLTNRIDLGLALGLGVTS
ncbi:TolC family protein [Shewanella surugensis]|uniref:TolC family protein n=1 Tax=Shewanella surugensis TaxID=212020 RepID=A0ABT0LFU1_9GAMM|nr:TolC family protein [Shewanella surugensis]MCL1126574.1 TolC family protein [Shewanella surugensis]